MTNDSRARTAPQSVNQVMAEGHTSFGRLLQRARALERLGRQVSGLLDAELARHCRLANVRDGRMIFACTSPACATRLRMQSGRLLDQLHAVGLEDIEAIDVKVTPSSGAG